MSRVRGTVRPIKLNGSDHNGQVYKPPHWAYELLKAYLDPMVEPTITDRCKSAGICRDTFYRYQRKPEFVAWFSEQVSMGVATEAGDARQALYKQVLAGNMEAIKFWYEKYGEFIPTQRHIVEGDLSGVSTEDLEAAYRLLTPKNPGGAGEKVH